MKPRNSRQKALPSLVLVALSALLLPAPSHAQFGGEYKNIYTGRTFNNPMSASLDLFVMQGMQRRMMYRSMLRSKGYSDAEITQITNLPEEKWLKYTKKKQPITDRPATVTKTTSANTTAKPAVKPKNTTPATQFKPVGKRLLLNEAADALADNDEEKSAYRTIFAEVARAYEAEARRLGFPNDLAGALTFYTQTAYAIYKPDTGEVSDAGTRAMVRQLHGVMDNDELRKTPAADKQKMYEYYISLGAYLFALSEIAKQSKNEEARAGAVKLGGEALKALFKVEPSRVRLTDKGVEFAPEYTEAGTDAFRPM